MIKNRNVSILIVVFLIVSITWIYFKKTDISPKICFEDNCFYVEIVDDDTERTLGLMNREYLEPDAGMLFIFDEEGSYPFWMKNTLIPLDMIWLNSNGEIVYIFENAQPCVSNPCPIIAHDGSALFVVELNAGTVNEKEIQVGQTAKFEID